jgi:ribosomal-protein-alanine acetyltransferase
VPAISVRSLQTSDIPRVLEIQAACPEAASWSEADYRSLEGPQRPSWKTTVAVIDKQLDKQLNGQMDEQMEKQLDKLIDKEIDKEIDEQITGFLTYAAAENGDQEVLNLAVDPDHRRQGVAEALLRALLQQISDPLFLEVRAGNSPALSFYHKLGFAKTGQRRSYYRNPTEDAIIMILSR